MKKNNYLVALKFVNLEILEETNSRNLLLREIKISTVLDHPNILKLFGFFSIQNKKKIVLILEYCPHGELYQFLHLQVNYFYFLYKNDNFI